ncbi:cohesin domain-containing protein [Anatilimnocola floriformis]|uniref:cohesin domain-containing protein n=1 Tax=Anatilimnocola floriformis TaxID=2948575 RepID=UPI0020C5B0CF|nr:cohesin domain-containing protein [Anatilimnocola floriformis]
MRLLRRLSFESFETRCLLAVVDIPDDLQGVPQQQVASPVNIDNAAGIRAAEIRLKYDPTVLDISDSQIVKGSVWGSDANVQVVANIDAVNGVIAVFISGADGLPSGSGSLVNFNFTVKAGATVGSTTTLDLTTVRLNEGAIVVNPAPQAGADATDGVITIGGSSGGSGNISGRVYADVNLNNLADTTEGIPGVTITLINTATNEQTQVVTSATGEFQFTNLAAGSYRIQQKQPAAFINGGVNELSVTITAAQSLTDQNFRELGLKPEYVYNRLFTSLVMPVGSTAWTDTVTTIVAEAEAGIVRALRVTPPASSAASSTSDTSTSLTTTTTTNDVDANADSSSSAGESVETVMANNAPLSAGEATADSADAALLATVDSLNDSAANDAAFVDADATVPPADQDDVLLALLAADGSDEEGSGDGEVAV